MKEHEQLNEINELIGFNYEDLWFRYYSNTFVKDLEVWYRVLDVREIIFTPEFMEKFMKYIENNIEIGIWWINQVYIILCKNNLRDPVSYLHNLLPWTKK